MYFLLFTKIIDSMKQSNPVLRQKQFFNLASITGQRPKSYTKWKNQFWQLDEKGNCIGQVSPVLKALSDK